jgi:hypothetical protein
MYLNKNIPLDESDNGKYIIIKIPRKTLYWNGIEPLVLISNQRNFRRTLRTIGFIITFLIGIIIGSIYHNKILSVNSDHATWKMFTTATKMH